MQNNKDIMTSSEKLNEQETSIREEELEFLPSDVDMNGYFSTEETSGDSETKQDDAATEESSVNTADAEETAAEIESDEICDNESSPWYLIKLVLILATICMVIALLLSLVNNITKDRIAENVQKQQQNAILSIFPEGTDTEECITADGESVYVVNKDGIAIGYCVNSSGTGFGGAVQVMVGFNADKTVKGIKIVSMSETPGIGTKVQGDSFMSQFFGVSSTDDVDIISGATFSSKAVIEAVNNAFDIDFDIEAPGNKEQN